MLETDRLLILPLSRPQLLQYLQNDGSLEAGLHLPPARLELTPDLLEAFEKSILPNVDDRLGSRFFYTLWTVVLKKSPCLVGDLCFKGPPNEEGEIEIGYGTLQEHRCQGYMTEAVGGMLRWAFAQPNVRYVLGETEKTNPASMKILENNFFWIYSETETTFWWRTAKIPDASPAPILP